MADVLVLGCGLIGTSIGLALSQSGLEVLLDDRRPEILASAVARGAGQPWVSGERVSTVVVAVPPEQIGAVLAEAQRLSLGRTYTHVSSVQSVVQADVERLNCDVSQIVGGHPLAGREQSGPQAADAELFAGRPWAICPSSESSPAAVAAVRALAETCGATPIEVEIDVHDASVARLSHLPQVAASALAGLLEPGARGPGDTVHFDLSGQGLVDTTRLAAGDPELWTQILAANARHVGAPVREVAVALQSLADDLDSLAAKPGDREARARLRAFLERGRAGRRLVPVKRGKAAADFATVSVDVDDRPGRLAALLTAAGEAGINVEDVNVEHVPGRPRGLIALLVRDDAVSDLSTALTAGGWSVRRPTTP